MQRSLFCRFSFALAAAIAAVFAAQAETYYWTGAAETASTAEAENWALESGAGASSAPGEGDTVVFTNTTELTLSNSSTLQYLNYRFEGSANVKVNPNSEKVEAFLNPNGSIYVSNGAKAQFDYKETMNAAGEFCATVAGTGKLNFSYGEFKLAKKDCIFKKNGDGTFSYKGSKLNAHANAGILLEEGTLDFDNNKPYTNDAPLSVTGSASKTISLTGAINLTQSGAYSEDAVSEGKLAIISKGTSGPRTVTFNCPSDIRFTADVYNGTSGNISNPGLPMIIIWDPQNSESVMTVAKRDYTKVSGAFRVASGTMRFADGAKVTALGSIAVDGGATLAISDDVGSTTFGCPISVAEGGTLRLDGDESLVVTVSSLTTNGVAVADGVYRIDDLDCLSGGGVLIVGSRPDEPATTTATWTGNGGGDTSVLNPANWGAADNETLPDLTTGSLEATFPVGTEATVPAGATVAFKGIAVSAPSFTLKGGAGSKVALGSSGVTVTGAVFTNECFTAITRSQTWDVANNSTNVWVGEVAADWPTVDTLTLTNGLFVICNSNPSLCNVDYYTDIEAHADVPLGGGLVTAEQKANDKVVFCYGNVFSNNFDVAINNWQNNHFNLVKIVAGENLFCGEFKSSYPNGHYWRFADNNDKGKIDESISATFKGGYAQASLTSYTGAYTAFSAHCNGIINIEEKPISVVRMFVGWISTFRQILNLNVASNVTTRGIHILPGSTLNTTVPYALYATDDGQSGVQLHDLAVWNLSADQGVNVFAGITNTAKVSSANGATLHLRDDRLNTVKPGEAIVHPDRYQNEGSLTTSKVQTNKVVFAGNVNFSKEGILDHFMEGVSTSTGSISVKKGRMIFTTGSWQNASGVSVSDGGTLELRNGKAFSKDTPVSFTGENTDGMLVIPSGTTVKLSNVTVNGKILNGTYSSGLVAGGGTLTAGHPGMSIIFR